MDLFPYFLLRMALLPVSLVVFLMFLYFHITKAKARIFSIQLNTWLILILSILLFAGSMLAGKATPGYPAIPPLGHAQGPFEKGPQIPVESALAFFLNLNNFEKVDNIASDPANLPTPTNRNESRNLVFELEAKEVLAEITNGTTFNYWTINGTVPGPMLRARVGDNITITLKNSMSSLHTHSIDFHAATGPGGGAKYLQVPSGETKSMTFKALNPGLYIYHCASSPSVAAHMAHGQYGLILIEPEEGLPPVDKEFYVVQGELYTQGDIGDKGLVPFDSDKMLDELPTYVVFNGKVGGLGNKMKVNVSDKVRIFVGNGGVGKVSSFHVIGEIFDSVYPEGAIGSDIHKNIQSTIVPAGGATIVEFQTDTAGTYVIVDHSLARMDRGAWGVMHVEGKENPGIISSNN